MPLDFIHDLKTEKIRRLLTTNAWSSQNQSINSATTNDNTAQTIDLKQIQLGENTEGIHAFVDISFDKKVKKILDVGGGKFNYNQHYMQQHHQIDLWVWDPYNRSLSHNQSVQKNIMKNKADAASSMSVLNVIPELELRLAHINTLKAAIHINDKAYFKIWPGTYSLKGSYLPSRCASSYQANAYADRFVREIEVVFGAGNVYFIQNVPNLLIAIKKTETPPPQHEIRYLQKRSQIECGFFKKCTVNAIQRINEKQNIRALFSTNLAFFKKMEEEFIFNNKHQNSQIQQEHDKRYGLVLYCPPS